MDKHATSSLFDLYAYLICSFFLFRRIQKSFEFYGLFSSFVCILFEHNFPFNILKKISYFRSIKFLKLVAKWRAPQLRWISKKFLFESFVHDLINFFQYRYISYFNSLTIAQYNSNGVRVICFKTRYLIRNFWRFICIFQPIQVCLKVPNATPIKQ